MAYMGGEHQLRTFIEHLIVELHAALQRVYLVKKPGVEIEIVFKILFGDHHCMGNLLAKKMGTRHVQSV
jgi:hypothetical protein